jgi:isopenicillin-N epimerase
MMPGTTPSTAWPTTPEEESYWDRIREQYLLDPDEIYLNTGSFGAQPRPVLERALQGLRDGERSPSRDRGPLGGSAQQAKVRLGRFVNALPDNLAFTINVTVAINMVVLGLDWSPGDEILASDHEYGAIDNCLHHAEQRYGVVVRRARIPVPPSSEADVLDAFE